MADELAVAALVRKRAELAGRVAHARAELGGLLAGLAALDATLRLFDPGIRVEAIRPKLHRPPGGGPGIAVRDVLTVLREAAGPLAAREIAGRLLPAGTDERALRRAAESVRRALGKQARKGVVERARGAAGVPVWRLAGPGRSLGPAPQTNRLARSRLCRD